MRALIQRVTYASVVINQEETRKMEQGILILLGVREGDDSSICSKLAEKCAGLRVFDDAEGKLNLSAVDLQYSAMVVSNFTLYGDTRKGKRPSFSDAAKAPVSVECYNEFVACLQKQGLKNVVTGEFGADMQIELVNDGPITIMLDTDEWKNK